MAFLNYLLVLPFVSLGNSDISLYLPLLLIGIQAGILVILLFLNVLPSIVQSQLLICQRKKILRRTALIYH